MNGKRMIASVVVFIVAGGMLLLNCKGDDGAVGPKGKDGNANVIYSKWMVAKNFTDSVSDNTNVKVGHISAPLITDSVLNNGVVIVYMNYGAGPFQLPYTSFAGGKASTISFWIKPGKLMPYRFTHDNSNSVSLSTSLQYRYIIVPANMNADSVAASGRIAAKDYPDYEELCKAYGIPL